MTSRSPATWQYGAFLGLVLLTVWPTYADDALRKQVHRDYGHRSYMLVEDAEGARLFLFSDGTSASTVTSVEIGEETDTTAAALRGTRDEDPRNRVRALTQLAGIDRPEALDVALTLLSDPSPAVRDEARSLILDHPDGEAMVDALGLIDEDTGE